MFDNIGSKIKTVAIVLAVIGIAASVIYGCIMMTIAEEFIASGFLIMLLGSFISWVSSFTLYGFGEIITQLESANINLERIRDLLNKIDKNTSNNTCENTQNFQTAGHKWVCSSCGNLRDRSPCPYCGNK